MAEAGAFLGKELEEALLELSAALGQRFRDLGSAVATVTKGLLSIAAAPFKAFGDAVTTSSKALLGLGDSTKKAGAAGGEEGGLVEVIGEVAGKISAAVQDPIGTLANVVGPALSKVTEQTGMLAGAMGSFAKGLTGSLMGPFQQLAGAVAPFVQALNPALMRLFNQAMRDLMATFGVAFAPIIQHITALFNELSATLLPAMQALAPIIDNLMSVLEGALVPVIGIIADAFVALSPVILFVTSIMASISEAMRVFYTVLRSAIEVVYQVIAQMFGGIDLKGAASEIRAVIQRLTLYFVQFAAYIAKALGYLDPFAAALKKNLTDLEGKKPGIKAAPENVHVTGLEQLSKDIAVAAFSSMGAGGKAKKSEAEFLEELVKAVTDVQENGKTLQDFLKEIQDKIEAGIGVTINEVGEKIWVFLSQKLKEEIKPIVDAILHPTTTGGQAAAGVSFGGLLPWLMREH